MANPSELENFGNAVKAARLAAKRSQRQLSERVKSVLPQGAPRFYQEKLSKIERADRSLTLTKDEILTLQQVCKLEDTVVTPLLELLEKSEKAEGPEAFEETGIIEGPDPTESPDWSIRIHVPEIGQLLSSVSSPTSELAGYCGEYYSLFLSTDSADKRLVEGKLKIFQDQADPNLCSARMILYDQKRKPIKWYSGTCFINRHYRTWHCILIGHKKQEVCMLTASHFNATLRQNQFNMALALTTSAGSQKRPTVHRLFFSRNPIPKKDRHLIQAQLLLNTDSICISENALLDLEKDTNLQIQKAKSKLERSEYQAVLAAIQKIRELGQKETYYTIDESIIYDAETIAANKRSRGFAVSRIRIRTGNVYYNKISQTVLEICTNILEKRKKF